MLELPEKRVFTADFKYTDHSDGTCCITAYTEENAKIKYDYFERRHPEVMHQENPKLEEIFEPEKLLRERIKPYEYPDGEFSLFGSAVLHDPIVFSPRHKFFECPTTLWIAEIGKLGDYPAMFIAAHEDEDGLILYQNCLERHKEFTPKKDPEIAIMFNFGDTFDAMFEDERYYSFFYEFNEFGAAICYEDPEAILSIKSSTE